MKLFYKPPRDTNKLPLDRNENLSKQIKRRLSAILNQSDLNFNLYPDNLLQLNCHISNYHGVNPEEIVLTNGSEEALTLLFNHSLPIYKNVIKWEPTFGLVDVLLRRHNSQIINYGFNLVNNMFVPQYKFDNLSSFQKYIFYISSPNSPTGSVFDKSMLTLLVKEFTNSLFILDGAYVNYDADYYISLYKRYNNVVLVRTFSKSWGMAGLRAGYYITKNTELQDIRPNYAPNVVASTLLNYTFANLHSTFSYVEETVSIKKTIQQFLMQLGINYIIGAGNFILIDQTELDVEWLASKCLFKFLQINKKKYIKISIPDKLDINLLLKSLKKLR